MTEDRDAKQARKIKKLKHDLDFMEIKFENDGERIKDLTSELADAKVAISLARKEVATAYDNQPKRIKTD